MAPEKKWFNDFFEDFHDVLELQSARKASAEARYIMAKLRLKKGMSFLDCPCGIGRISIPLAKLGIRVTGVDLTSSYLERLNAKAAKAGVRIATQRGDMRRLAFANRFDGAANLGTSLGYFEREADNVLVLKRLYAALKPGGRLMVQIVNRDWILKHYTTRDWERHGDLLLLHSRQFDYRTSRNHGPWTFIKKDGREVTHEVSLRMYSFHELAGMFEQVGFEEIEGFGSVKEEPIDTNCLWMWLIGRKPK